MSEEQKRSWVFNQKEIFQEIPEDPENVNMTIPPEVCEAANLQPGDQVKISIGDKGTMIIEKVNKE